jgi:hypothetical protein
MVRAAAVVAFFLALAPVARAAVEITTTGDRVDVSAAGVAVSEVLDGLARKTKMKVVYEGAAPRTPVTVDLRGRTLAGAVLGVLDGLGLNYALVLDPSGTTVETLMIVGAAPRVASPVASAASTRPARSVRREPRDASQDIPEKDDDLGGVGEDERIQEAVAEAKAEEILKGAMKETLRVPPAAVGPLNPTTAFPVSPFAPAAPRPLQPFVPVIGGTPAPSPSPATE